MVQKGARNAWEIHIGDVMNWDIFNNLMLTVYIFDYLLGIPKEYTQKL